MGIRVECPHGHVFKVKDKYAGKRGLCPHCPGQVEVRVPQAMTAEAADQAYRQAVIQEHRAAHPAPPPPSSPPPSSLTRRNKKAAASSSSSSASAAAAAAASASVFDDEPSPRDAGASASGSLLGSSVIRHNLKCGCGASVPMWYARCPACGKYMEK